MNVALLHYAAHPIVGGVENVMREHSRLMASAGHRVKVIAGRGAQVDPDVEFVNVPLVDSQAPEILAAKRELDQGKVPRGFEDLSAQIESALRSSVAGADWLVAHNVCSLNKNLPLTAALRRISAAGPVPRMAIWHHDLAWTTPRYAAELHPGYPWDLLRTDWPSAVHVTVSNHRKGELAHLMGIPDNRIRVVPNGIDAGTFLGLRPETLEVAYEFRLFDAAPLILVPARITRRKNIEMALRIMARLQDGHLQARLIVTGPAGPHNKANSAYLDSLLDLRTRLGLEETAIFLTWALGRTIPDEVVNDLYRLADAMLLPSTEEGFGIPILEAGLAGIPVFCSEIEPLRELGGTEATYFSIDADPSEVAEQIVRVLETSPRYILRKRILREHAWGHIYSKYLAPLLAGANA